MWCTYMYSGKHTHKRTIGHLSFLSSYNFLHLDNTPLSSWKQCRLARGRHHTRKTPHFAILVVDFPEVFLATCTFSHMVTLVSL